MPWALITGMAVGPVAGEPFDIVITGSPSIDQLIETGKVVAETRANIARSGIGVEVRTGARKPEIGTVEAFKRALLEAKSIAYLRVGSGLYLAGLFERLGIAEAIQSKVTRPDSDIVSELVAKGEVELGIVVITQILTTRGVELVGPLPPEIQSYVTFTGAVSRDAKAADAARQLMNVLAGRVSRTPNSNRWRFGACGPSCARSPARSLRARSRSPLRPTP